MDGMGAFYVGGRWNSPGTKAVYGSLSYACAMLEVLVHLGTERLPAHFVDVTITIPDEIAVEEVMLPTDWRVQQDLTATLGDEWVARNETLVLIVPSAVAKNESNIVINPARPDFGRIIVSKPSPVAWDGRLFGVT